MAEFVAHTRYSDIPIPVSSAAKRIIRDTIGCAMGALATDLGEIVRVMADEAGGGQGGVCTVIGTDQKVPVLAAAYANGRLANIIDFDDTYKMRGHHAHCALAGALAVCEFVDADAKSLLTSFSVGFEVGARVALYIGDPAVVNAHGIIESWHNTIPVMSVYAACAAACNALRLSPAQIEHAFGICPQYLSASPSLSVWRNRATSVIPEVPTIKYEDTGWSAQAGVLAALLASRGVTGVREAFDHDDGLWRQVRPIAPDFDALVFGLGEHWELPLTSLKPWPCCRSIHYSLTAFQKIMNEEGLSADEVERVELLTFEEGQRKDFFKTQEFGSNILAVTINSYPHAAAMVALKVPPGLEWLSPEVVHSEPAKVFRRRVFTGIDPVSPNFKAWGTGQGVLKIPSSAKVTARGRVYTRRSDYALGDPWSDAPRYWEDEEESKFVRLAMSLAPDSYEWRQAVPTISKGIMTLEKFGTAREFSHRLHPDSQSQAACSAK